MLRRLSPSRGIEFVEKIIRERLAGSQGISDIRQNSPDQIAGRSQNPTGKSDTHHSFVSGSFSSPVTQPALRAQADSPVPLYNTAPYQTLTLRPSDRGIPDPSASSLDRQS